MYYTELIVNDSNLNIAYKLAFWSVLEDRDMIIQKLQTYYHFDDDYQCISILENVEDEKND